MGEHEPKSAGLYRKSTGSNASTLARSKTHSLARAKRGEPDSLSASEEEDLKDRYYAYWERQKQVGKRLLQSPIFTCSDRRYNTRQMVLWLLGNSRIKFLGTTYHHYLGISVYFEVELRNQRSPSINAAFRRSIPYGA